MRSLLAFVSAATGTFALYRWLTRQGAPTATVPAPDERAEELRAKLAESRTLVEERDAFEAGETPVDAAEPGPPNAPEPDERRRRIHERARAATERMRGGESGGD